MHYVKGLFATCRGILQILSPVALCLGFTLNVWARPSPEEVSRQLVAAFAVETGKTPSSPAIVENQYVGLKTRTLTFGIGNRIYRIVFSSDGSISVALTTQGELGAQPLWTSSSGKTTIDEIVNVVFSREFGRRYKSTPLARSEKSSDADLEASRVKGNEVRWNRFMNRILHGDITAISQSGGSLSGNGLDQAANTAKMLDPCAPNRSGSAQRQALTDIAQAIAASGSKTTPREDEILADRSRAYKKQGSSSFLKDLNKHETEPHPEEAIRLIQQSGGDAYDLFRAALRQSDDQSRDPYALAALRNFRIVARQTDEKRGRALIDSVLSKTVVDVEQFTKARRSTPKASVIYNRKSGEFYIDPTLNSPAQARYLLSLAVLYAWKCEQPETVSLLEKYDQARKKISVIEHAVLDEKDERELALQRAEAEKLSRQLFQLVDELRKTEIQPNSS